MARAFSLFLSLLATWLLLSGHYQPLLISLGAISSALVVAISWRMRIIDAEGHPVQLVWRALRYWSWLALEIGKANVEVARHIVNPTLKISPRVLRVPTGQRTGVGRATYANSINLTPGTVSLEIENDAIQVHALDERTAENLMAGAMDRQVTRMEGSK